MYSSLYPAATAAGGISIESSATLPGRREHTDAETVATARECDDCSRKYAESRAPLHWNEVVHIDSAYATTFDVYVDDEECLLHT
jgi:hypothetical protein